MYFVFSKGEIFLNCVSAFYLQTTPHKVGQFAQQCDKETFMFLVGFHSRNEIRKAFLVKLKKTENYCLIIEILLIILFGS